jgi:SPP1 family predicted phage head-tail adaptor
MKPAGKRYCRMVIQSVTQTVTTSGATTDVWTEFATVYAAIEPLSTREAFLAQASQNTATHKITFPYTSGITPRMRGIYNNRTFYFSSVKNLTERNVEIEVVATEAT